MDSNTNALYVAAGLPALIYIFLKVWRYLLYAISHETEGRLAAAMPSGGQQINSANTRTEGHTKVYEQIPGHITDQHGTGSQQTSGSLPVPRRWQDLCLTSCGDAAEYPAESPFRENGKRLQGRKNRNTTDSYGEEPGSAYGNSTGVFAESGGWTNASDGQPSDDERPRGKE